MIMKKYFFVFTMCCLGQVHASVPPETNTLHQDILEAQSEHNQHMKTLTTIAATFFNPQPAYATTSFQEKAIDSFFGPLNVGQPMFNYIKNFYFYLEYVTKIEYAGRLLAKAKTDGNPFLETIKTYGWQKLLEQLKVSSLQDVITFEPSWQDVQPCILATMNHEVTKPSQSFWQDLTTTSFWKSLTINSDTVIKSIFWQNYLKFSIANTLTLDFNFLLSRYESEKAIFKYLPNIEIAYFHPDFTQLRTSSELASIALIVNEHKRNRLLKDCIDWKKFITSSGINPALVDAVATFSTSSFYMVAQDVTMLTSNQQKQPLALQPPAQEYLICLTMIIILQTFLADQFSLEKLDATMQKIKRPRPQPSILPYDNEDYPYLYELNTLKSEVATAALDNQQQEQKIASGSASSFVLAPATTKPQVVVQNFADWLAERGSDVWNTIKKTGEAIYATAHDVQNIIDDETKALYYSSGLAGIIQQVPPEQAKQLAQAAQAAASGDFKSFRNDTKELLEGVVKLATYPASFEIDAVLTGIGQLLNDPALAKDFDGYWNAIIDTAAEALATPLQMGAIAVEAGLKLSIDGIHLISQVVVDVFTGRNVGSDIVQGFKQLAYDVVNGVLAGVTFTIGKVKEELADIMKACGYLIKLLTDLVIDIGADITAIGKYLYLQTIDPGSVDFGDLYKQQQAAIGEHRRFIAQIVTATLVIIGSAAFTVVTGGTGLPLAMALVGGLAFNAGFGVFMGMTGYQSDQEVALLKQEQHDYVETFSVWTNNKKAIVQAQQIAMTQELDKKFAAEITNQERSLGFFQNFLGNIFENVVEQESTLLGAYQAALLTPDPSTQAVFADVGSTYGYSTGWLDLNPSQGFSIFSPARQHASQEIAEFPKLFKTDTGTSQLFWFKQNTLKQFNKPADQELTIEVRLRAIYVLSSFYLGLLIGGNPLDINKIIKEQRADIARDHLAKMLIFKRAQTQDPTTFGVYEHEGLGWITNAMASPPFDVGQWYHIKAHLSGTILQVKVWKDGDEEPSWSTFTISKTGQQTIGVIFSGASLEWEMLTPPDSDNLQPLPALYKPYKGPIEKTRGITAQKDFSALISPTFGSYNLAAIGISELLKNQFIYTTSATTIAQETNNAITKDYAILGSLDATTGTISSAGLSPTISPTALISLISGKFFDQRGQELGTWSDAWSTYQNAHKISDSVINIINHERELYATKLVGPYTFGSFTLNASSAQDIVVGQYIYTTGTDYFLMAKLDTNNNVIDSGMAYSANINGILSLVSGNVYNKTSSQPVNSGYTDQLIPYQRAHGALRKDLLDTIMAAQKKYMASQQTPPVQKILPIAPISTQPTIPIPPSKTTGGQISFGPPTTPQSSITERQQAASESNGW